MFESLKKKLGSFFGKKDEKEVEKQPKKVAKAKKTKIKAEKKPKKEKIVKTKFPKVSKKPSKTDKKPNNNIKVIEKSETPTESKEIIEEKRVEVKEEPLIESNEIIEVAEEKPEIIKEKKKFSFWPFGKKEEKEEKVKEIEIKETPKEEKIEENIEKIEEKVEEVVEKVEEQQEKELAEIKEEKEEGFFSKFVKKLSTSTITLEKKHVDEIFSELEIILLENNVALEVVDKIRENLEKDLVGIEVKKDKIESTIIDSLKNSILEVLIEPPNLIDQIKSKEGPYTILFFGINGSGKTTSIAKIAHMLKKNNISCVLAAGDTFRAASIEQLEKHANNLNVPIIKSQYGADPASVAFDAKKYAESNNIKVVLIDTAGRMYTKSNLLKEMEKIVRISKPDLKIFVGESITGNDATEQAKTFNETIGIDGIILSKADVDDKAGTILSVSYVTQKPIYFLGVGQSYDEIQIFKKDTVLKNIGL